MRWSIGATSPLVKALRVSWRLARGAVLRAFPVALDLSYLIIDNNDVQRQRTREVGMSEEERLTLQEAADELGISEVTARRWVKAGKLKAFQPGRRYLIPRSAVDGLLRPAEGPPELETTSPRVREWLGDQGAVFVLMADAEFQELVLNMEIGADEGALLEGVEDLIGKITAEDLAVERALMREFVNGGELFPEVSPGPGEAARAFARHKAVTRLQRALADDYGVLRRALVNYSRRLYSSGRTSDFLAHPREVEAMRQQMLEEAFAEEVVGA